MVQEETRRSDLGFLHLDALKSALSSPRDRAWNGTPLWPPLPQREPSFYPQRRIEEVGMMRKRMEEMYRVRYEEATSSVDRLFRLVRTLSLPLTLID